MKTWAIYGGILAILIGVLIVRIATLPSPPPRVLTPEEILQRQDNEARQRAARGIEYCEDRYKEMNADRQYTPDMLRFHSMTCDKMRSDYRARWGRDP